MKCCGKEVGTPYCPFCGKHVMQNSIFGLLQYLHITLKSVKGQYKTAKQKLQAEGKVTEGPEFEQWRENWQKNISKWESWQNALEDLLAKHKDEI